MSDSAPSLPVMNDCPVKPLGAREGVYFFARQDGEIVKIPARSFTVGKLVRLLGGNADWLRKTFPAQDRACGFHVLKATAVLMRACHAKGIWENGGRALV